MRASPGPTTSACGFRLPMLLALLLALVMGSPEPGSAQRGNAGWAAPQAGIRFGYDDNAQATVLGGQLRIPVLPGGQVELVPSGDVVFLDGLREYQVHADAVWVTGGRSGGLFGGVGLAVRNGIFEELDRETRTGANLVLGLVTRGRFQGVPLGVQLEGRWVFMDTPVDPRVFTFGVNLPLWGWGSDD